jgi:F420-dependent oxidoreductase-like protein
MQLFAGQVRFGIHSGPQNTTYDDYLALWQKAEELGFDWASVFDHFMPIQSDPAGPCFEGLALLSALAAQTRRVRCGILVVGNTYRHPAVVANIAATIDHVSRGRLELGMGAAWYELEHRQYGILFPSTGRRIRMLGEAVKVIKALWTQERATFHGRYYTISEAFCEPKPLQRPHIPLWVGGQGEKLTLRVVAESADGWNTFMMPMEAYRRKLDALASHCRDVGRDPEDIRKSLVFWAVLRPTEREAREEAERVVSATGNSVQALGDRLIVGTPEQCAERLLPYVRVGVGDFLISTRAPADWQTLELLAREVAPTVKQEGSRILASRG